MTHAPVAAVPHPVASPLLAPSRVMRFKLFAGLHGLIALTAMAGGGAMTTWPSGEKLGFAPPLLAHSPFTNFLVPGLLLYGLGALNGIAAYLFLRREPRVEVISAIAGTGLVIWIGVQAAMLQASSWLQLAYAVLGAVIVAHALWSLRPSRP